MALSGCTTAALARVWWPTLSGGLVAVTAWWPRGRHCLVAITVWWPSLSGGNHCLVSGGYHCLVSGGHHCLMAIIVWWPSLSGGIIVWWPSLSGVWWLSLLIITYVYRDTIWWYKPFACLECRLDIKPPVSKPILPGLSITSGRTTRH